MARKRLDLTTVDVPLLKQMLKEGWGISYACRLAGIKSGKIPRYMDEFVEIRHIVMKHHYTGDKRAFTKYQHYLDKYYDGDETKIGC